MGTGEHRAMDAVEHAIESPLLETSLEGARSILLSVTGGRDLSLWEVNEAAKAVAEAAHPEANIIFGAMVDEKVVDQVWVTVVATGYGDRPLYRAAPRGEHARVAHPGRRRAARAARPRERAGGHAGRRRRARVHPALAYGSAPVKGVVAAGHPLTAEAGADVLREGGNAVDAAVACVLMSFVAESPLTGPGRGRLHARPHGGRRGPPARLLRRRARAGARRPASRPSSRRSTSTSPRTRSSASTSVRRRAAPTAPRSAWPQALERFGTLSLADLTAGAGRAAREGIEVVPMQAFLFSVLEPILRSTPGVRRAVRARRAAAAGGRALPLRRARATCSTASAPRGRGSSTPATWPAPCSEWVLERGGLLTREDLAAYEVVEREPARVSYRGREVLTNPPPSSGGILIADALGILERLERPARRRR